MDNPFKINNCAIILLAAGASDRMGKPKQLLTYKGKSFLKNMVSVAIHSHCNPVIVVLGAHATEMNDEIMEEKDNIHIVYNTGWTEGISSSIRCGIETLKKINPASDGTFLMVCDQPYLTVSLLNDLLNTQHETGRPIVAAHYSGIAGTPALFHKIFFPELLKLEGDKGAGKILRQHEDLVATVLFPEGIIDIDTPDNYKKLNNND